VFAVLIQLRVMNGPGAGSTWVASSLPASFGRSPADGLRCEAKGVWEGHFNVRLEKDGVFVLSARAEAFCRVNGSPVSEVPLRHGDVIDAGEMKLCFGFADAPQKSLRAREVLAWVLILGLGLLQLIVAALLF